MIMKTQVTIEFLNHSFLIISSDVYSASVDLSGRLHIKEKEIDTEKFCLAKTWEMEGYAAYDRKTLDSFDGALALSCDLCKEEVGVVAYWIRCLIL